MTVKTHISNLVRSANFELSRISSTRHYLSTDATYILISAFVLSHVDCCNSLPCGCPQYLLNKLQKGQTNVARHVLRVIETFRIAPHLSIGCSLIHEYSTNSPLCATNASAGPLLSTALTELLEVYKPTRQPRCSDTSIDYFFVFPLCARTHLDRDLFFASVFRAAPSVWNSLPWNSLPCEVRSSNTLKSFSWSLTSSGYPVDCVCVCVCVCVCARARAHARAHARSLARVSLFWLVLVLCFVTHGLDAPIWRDST